MKVDSDGVLRFADDNSEVALFGVNYYVPFSIDYKRIADLGLDHDQAIREDVAHFQRLGLTAIRLHCFDREISDREGNLLDNEHLRLLDLLIAECKARGIYCVMTPIAWWGAPQPGGFSDLYTMNQMTTDMTARAAQCRYLIQYMNHVNRYTGLAYKDDPAVPVIELINEPLYPKSTTDAQVTRYMEDLAAAVRSTGCRKPIFYNCWQNRLGALGASTLEGGTFGWYPTGLVNGSMLKGDFLPRVNDYPSMRDERIARKAKIVYEFDAADVHYSYMYPAMARAFRSGGAQIATQFQYEPMCIGGTNSNWQTHYLNLVYTPHKAISFAIAAEAFRRIPRLAAFGEHPASDHFGDFIVSCEKDLSQLAAPDAFLYSNDTDTRPPAPDKLARIAGCGSSPLVTYSGTGAYFLDRLGAGVWALQVYPDAVMIADPYTGGNNEKVRVLWGKWPMRVCLPDLAAGFSVFPVSADRVPGAPQPAPGGSFEVSPGEYVLVASGQQPPQRLTGPTFLAPPSSTAVAPGVFCQPPRRWVAGKPLAVRATVAAAPDTICELRWHHVGSDAPLSVPMRRIRNYEYEGTIPAEAMTEGAASFCMIVRGPTGTFSFPGGRAGEQQPETAVPPLRLVAFSPGDPLPAVSYSGPAGRSARASFGRGSRGDRTCLAIDVDAFGDPPSCAGVTLPVQPITGDVSSYASLRIVARGGSDTHAMELTLLTGDATGFGTEVRLPPEWREILVPLDKLRPMWKTPPGKLDLKSVVGVKVVFGAWLLGEAAGRPHSVEVESVDLVNQAQEWDLDVLQRGSEVEVVEFGLRRVRFNGQRVTVANQRPGMDRDKMALRVTAAGFGEEPSSAGARLAVEDDLDVWRADLTSSRKAIITARALYPQTKALEVVFIEKDGAPWGLNLPLTTDWQAISVPLDSLRYFAHWKSGPPTRGTAGDRFHPEDVQAVSLCFGAWLYGEDRTKPHGFEIQDVRFAN